MMLIYVRMSNLCDQWARTDQAIFLLGIFEVESNLFTSETHEDVMLPDY